MIEKKPVITEVLDPQAKTAGVSPGDIVTAVDGENITARFHRLVRYTSASTTQRLGYDVIQRIMNGPDGSTATLTVEGPDGQSHKVQLTRRLSYLDALRSQRTRDAVEVQPNRVAYVDLDRLLPADLEATLDKLRSASSIILDLRGDEHGVARLLAPRLAQFESNPVAILTGPITFAPDLPPPETLTSTASYFLVQRLSPALGPKLPFTGKLAVLVDERTIGLSEHAALLFEAGSKPDFIGSPTAGADSELTNIVVPEGITVYFSGRDVRHGNGGPLQRLGFQPTLSASATIKGIRSGQDEVLDKAFEYLAETDDKGKPRLKASRQPLAASPSTLLE